MKLYKDKLNHLHQIGDTDKLLPKDNATGHT